MRSGFDVGTGLTLIGFTLIGFTLGLGYGFTLEEWDAFRVGRGYVKRVLRC